MARAPRNDVRSPPAATAAEPGDAPRGAFERRSVLLAGAAAAAAAVVSVGAGCRRSAVGAPGSTAVDAGPTTPSTATREPPDARAFVPVLAAIAARLVPADEHGPGAAEAGVEAFFARALVDQRLASVQPLLKRGCAFLMKAARVERGQAFVALDAAAQDDLLRRLVDGQMRPDGFTGPTFVRVALALTLEGYLGDPRHGGNKDGVGWRVVGFSPEGRAAGLSQPAPGLKVVP